MNPIHSTHFSTPGMSRRQWLQTAGLGLVGLSLPSARAWSLGVGSAATSSPQFAPLNRFPRMTQEYFVRLLRECERANHDAKAALETRADAEAYVRSVRGRIQECFGPFPEKTPLNPRITGVVERDRYRIENVLFESRPGFLVTGNLYLPKEHILPLPAVIGTCGHSNNGKAAEAYQAYAQGLVRLGYVVLIIDPIGQGERIQYPLAPGQSRVGVGVSEHLLAGNQQFLVGDFFGTWRAWDGIRALDYLLTREEVDPSRVGVTGNSGGGTMTTWLCGLESRWTMAAPSCFVTTFRRNLENELPADTEQCPPRALELGLDHEDFLAAMAPKPIIILGKEKDFFDIRGAEGVYARLKRLYRLLGAEENIGFFAGPTAHGYSQENREAMYRWFNRFAGVGDAEVENDFKLEPDETLWCTPRGQISEVESGSVFSFTRAKSRQLAASRSAPDPDRLRRLLRSQLRLPRRAGAPDFRILRALPSRDYPRPHATTYAVQTEPGIHAIVYRLSHERLEARPPRGSGPATLYVSHHSSDAELRTEPWLREAVGSSESAPFFTCDVRGVGESRPDTCGENSFLDPYGSDYFYAIHSLMLGRPYVGQKTHDVLSVLDWLESFGHTSVHLMAKGWGTLPATFASLLSDRVAKVTLFQAPPSYAAIAETEIYHWPLSSFLPGVLKNFDLPDCYATIADKELTQLEPAEA